MLVTDRCAAAAAALLLGFGLLSHCVRFENEIDRIDDRAEGAGRRTDDQKKKISAWFAGHKMCSFETKQDTCEAYAKDAIKLSSHVKYFSTFVA